MSTDSKELNIVSKSKNIISVLIFTILSFFLIALNLCYKSFYFSKSLTLNKFTQISIFMLSVSNT